MDEYYDSIADGYDRLYLDEQMEKVNFIFEQIKEDLKEDLQEFNEKDIRILDVGCGTGISTILGEMILKHLGIDPDENNLIGIDPSEKLIAKSKYKTVLGYAENLPFDENHFSIIISLSALQNFNDISKGIDEMIRVGKKLFIISIMGKSSLRQEFESAIKEKFSSYRKCIKTDEIFIAKI